MSAITPGEWTVHAFTASSPLLYNDASGTEITSHDIVIGSGEKILAQVSMRTILAGYPTVDNEAEQQANAALILAAKDLLAALERAEEFVRENARYQGDIAASEDLLEQINGAIAKAKGQS